MEIYLDDGGVMAPPKIVSEEEKLKVELVQKSNWRPYIPEAQLVSPPWEHKKPNILGKVLCMLGFHNYEKEELPSADLKTVYEYARCVRCGDTITTKKYPNPYLNREEF